MAEFGPRSSERAPCPECRALILVNADGRLRHHEGQQRGACPGSRQPAPGVSVRILKLKDGVVVKVRHAPGTVADEIALREVLNRDDDV